MSVSMSALSQKRTFRTARAMSITSEGGHYWSASTAVAVARGAAIVAIDKRNRLGCPLRIRAAAVSMQMPEKRLLGRRDTDIGGLKSGDLAEALIVGNAVDDQSVDIRELESRVFDRLFQRQHPEVVSIVFWEVAVARVPYPNDRVDARSTMAPPYRAAIPHTKRRFSRTEIFNNIDPW